MSFIKRGLASVSKRFSSNSLYSDTEAHELKKKVEYYETDLLKRLGTPAPSVDLISTGAEADVRLPRLPFNETMFYLMRWQSTILRTTVLKVKQEVFRETLKEGFDWEEKFKLKCKNCGVEYDTEVEKCEYCNSEELTKPDPSQKKIFEEFEKKANKAEQTFLDVNQELEDDVNTCDDQYLVIIKDYMFLKSELFGKVKYLMRGDPARFRIVGNESGERGGRWFVCVQHREFVGESAGYCEIIENGKMCGLPTQDVHYVETEGGQTPEKYYIEGEVIHNSKYEPSRLYGISPIFTLWVLARTLQLMDSYAANLYEKGRVKGVLGVSTDNTTYLEKWWDNIQDRLRKDPHYLPVVAIESGDKGKGRLDFVRLMDSLNEMGYTAAKDMMNKQIAALYGIMPIILADVSTGGGLNNEGLQITVTDRAVDWGQALYHTKLYPQLFDMLNITDWKLKLKPSREHDEMAELTRMDTRVTTAQKMLDMNFDVDMKDEEFVFSGQAKKESAIGMGGGGFQNLLPPGQSDSPQPDNTQGEKQCPPGKVSTPENPKCHPIEWEQNKSIELYKSVSRVDLEKGLIPLGILKKICQWMPFAKADTDIDPECLSNQLSKLAKKYPEWSKEKVLNEAVNTCSVSKSTELEKAACRGNPPKTQGAHTYHCNANDITYYFFVDTDGSISFEGAMDKDHNTVKMSAQQANKDWGWSVLKSEELDLEKSGDMLAHYACIGNKLRKAGIKPPFTRGRKFMDWWNNEKRTNPKARAINEDCNKAGEIGEHDDDYPDPPGYDKSEFDELRKGDFYRKTFSDYPNEKCAVCKNDFHENDIYYKADSGAKWCSNCYHKGERDDSISKAKESGQKVEAQQQKIETHFTNRLLSLYDKELSKLENLDDKNPKTLQKEIDKIVDTLKPKIEKLAFAEVLRAYKQGKGLTKDLTKMSAPGGTTGGKARLAKRLTSIIPDHEIYTEACLGMGSVFLKKEKAKENYLNDLNFDVFSIWKQLQAGSEEVYNGLIGKSWHPNENQFLKLRDMEKEQIKGLSELDRAFRTLYLRKYSHMGKESHYGDDRPPYKDPIISKTRRPSWLKTYESYKRYGEQLTDTEITCEDYKAVILKHDSPKTFHFIDPPYEEKFAQELIEFLPKLKGKYLVTFSENESLKKAFGEDCHIIQVRSQNKSGGVPQVIRKEMLIANYPVNIPKDSLFKSDDAPDFAINMISNFTKKDWQVLRAIYKENPFWQAFANMTQSVSDKLKEHITESYEAPNSARFKATYRDVNRQYPIGSFDKLGQPYTKERLEYITYGRIGKFSLGKVMEKMKRTVNTEAYRLERIARSETTAVTAKGREIAFIEQDHAGVFKYDWFGPNDDRTSDECTWIEQEVERIGKGEGVTMAEMKDIHKRANERFNALRKSKWNYRDFLPHANCRRALRRVS